MDLPKSKFQMVGTEGTGEYVGLAATSRGQLAVREYSPGMFRVRVEPTAKGAAVVAKTLTRGAGWKQPGDNGQNRFSMVVGAEGLNNVLAVVKQALGVETLKSSELDLAVALRHVAMAAGIKVGAKVAKSAIFTKLTAAEEY